MRAIPRQMITFAPPALYLRLLHRLARVRSWWHYRWFNSFHVPHIVVVHNLSPADDPASLNHQRYLLDYVAGWQGRAGLEDFKNNFYHVTFCYGRLPPLAESLI